MRAPIAPRRPTVRISHYNQVVSGRRLNIDRLDRAEYGIHAMLGGGFRKRSAGIERRRHSPRTRICLREAYEIRSVCCRALDPLHRIGNIAIGLAGRMRNRLHNGDTEGHWRLSET
jgi:hypothetical protein